MGCASAVNRKDDDERRVIRLDLNTIKSTSTPKNEINLMKLTEQLLKVLEAICGEDKTKFEKFQDLILNNTHKLDKKIDEVTYLLNMAKEQVLVFQENAQIINLCYDLVVHLTKMLELNQKTFSEKEGWYYRFSYVLIYEISEFQSVLSYMVESSQLKQQYQKSKEILILYSCVLGSIRFLEGISWGYSVFLMHQQLDQDNVIAVKVIFNLMLRLKQHFRENKDFANAFLNDKQVIYQPQQCFQSAISYSALERLITETNIRNEDINPSYSSFLQNQVFRKTYVSIKKQIDEWLRNVKQLDISVVELKKYKSTKSFTRSYLRDLKNPVLKRSTGEQQKSQIVDSTNQNDEILNYKPNFEIENSNNIFLLIGNDYETKVIVESFLQANFKARTKYKCCVLHHCVRENRITSDSYYIVKNIIFSILRAIPSLKNYMKLQEHNFIDEMIGVFDPEKLDLQQDYPDIFIKFCKVLKEIKLDYNVGIFVTGIENTFDQNRLENFIYILRSASIYLPNFLKIVLTLDKRPSKSDETNKIIKLLQTKTIIEVNDSEIYDKEGQSYFEFALNYSQPSLLGLLKAADIDDQDNLEQQLMTNGDNNNNSSPSWIHHLTKCKNSYRKVIQFVDHLILIQMQSQKLDNYQFDDDLWISLIKQMMEIDQDICREYLQILVQARGPMHLETMIKLLLLDKQDHNLTDNLQKILKLSTPLVLLTNQKLNKDNKKLQSDQLTNDVKTIVVIKSRALLKQVMIASDTQRDKKYLNEKILQYYQKIIKDQIQDQTSLNLDYQSKKDDQEGDIISKKGIQFEELDTYFRVHTFGHLAKSSCARPFQTLDSLFSVKNLYKQILYHKSYLRFRQRIQDLIQSQCLDKDDKYQLIQFANTLHLIEQTIRNEPLNFLDFCTQLRGRVLGENLKDFLKDLKQDIKDEGICYFKNFHHALRENPRIDIILKMPQCTVLKIKFLQDKKRVAISLSNGLIIFYNTMEHQIQKIFMNKMAIIDLIKIIDDKYLITAGMDTKIRIWNIENEKPISKFQIHPYATVLMVCHKEYIFTFGYDMKLAKFNFKNKTLDFSVSCESNITALKLLKTNDDANKFKVAAATGNGNIILYDLNLQVLKQISTKTSNEEVISLINLSNTEFLSFTKEGSISVMNNLTLDESKVGSIFNLKSEDYIDLILIKSREYFLFTLEKQKIEFYSASTFKRTDSWDYFFERDLVSCDKNKEGSKIFVADKAGYTVLFNFLKQLDQSKENLVPCNRRYDPVVCIEITEKLETNSIISCSQDRDLRIWRRDNGVFIKKYDLSSFTGENITAMKLGKDENMLFLGSKDMNVYLIDISKGKLCVVYEGHWNRVTSIYTIPNKDILITISESNIKVWDLEYDECIKNMNEHNSAIVYISQTPNDEEQVITIGSSFEFKTWNYVTGTISHSHEIELNKDKKELKNLNVVCCDVQEEMAYIALNTNEISVYSVKENKVLYSFLSYNDEQIIFLQGLKTELANYLLVVTRTACILYLVMKDNVKRLCSYLVNARKKPKKKKHENKYSYNVRYYFTSAKVMQMNQNTQEEGIRGPTNIPSKKIYATQMMQASTRDLQVANNAMDISSNNFNNGVGEGTNTIQKPTIGGVGTETISGTTFNEDESANGQNKSNYFSKIGGDFETARSKATDAIALVCLGDSRGFVHMNHLILK